jgi:ubiquinone/menaquinone biosynthesis C-methylase UbiE
MLAEARKRHPSQELVVADGLRMPLRSRSIDLVTSAQALHHIFKPVPFLKEMRRVCAPDGRVLIVDQLATESYEQIAFMNEVETLRDPSHAMSRPRSAFRAIVMAAGLDIVDEKLFEDQSRFSKWMWPGEFPEERIKKVKAFVTKFGREAGMDFGSCCWLNEAAEPLAGLCSQRLDPVAAPLRCAQRFEQRLRLG